MIFHDWLFPLTTYLLLIVFFYLGTAVTIRLLGRRVEASLSMAAAPAVRSKFQPYMEGVRGLLALNIFLIHCAEQYNFSRTGILFPKDEFYKQIGAAAVTYFFFMTGYLLWKGLLDNPNFSGARFLRGRFYRTFPAYFFAILLVFGIALGKAGFHLRVPLWKFAASFVLWVMFGLPMSVAINGYPDVVGLGAGVMWTLQVDWLYYLIFPLLVWFSRRDWRLLLLIGGGVVLYRSLLHYPALLTGNWARLEAFLAFFCTCISLGMVLAVVKARLPEWPWARSRAASAVAVFWLLAVECFVIPHWGLRESLLLAPPFVLLTYGNDFFGLFNSRPALLLGRVSYSIYLLHAIVLILCLHVLRSFVSIAGLSTPAFWLLMAPLGMIAIWASMLSHRFIEVPFSTLGRRRAAAAAIPRPQDASRAQVAVAIQEEAAELPGMAEAELLLDPKVRK
jgi:peptidoglycan/LPS O-acetylase OafA/YrhL